MHTHLFSKKNETDMNQPNQISIEKDFAAGKDAFYKAWTEEGQLKQWWKPMDKQLVDVQNDIREGGTVSYRFENDLTISGKYKEAKPGEKLVHSWNWELPDETQHKGEYQLTVGFSGDDENSKLSVRQENFQSEHSVQPHQEGWERALEDLKAHLEK